MKMLLLILFLSAASSTVAQIDYSFYPVKTGEAFYQQRLTGYKEGQEFKATDSVRFSINDINFGIYNQKNFAYRGGFRNNLFNGYGELVHEGGDNSFIYAGMWKDGRMEGSGRLTRFKDLVMVENYAARTRVAGLLQTWGTGQQANRIYEFKGLFENGKATHGLYISAFDATGNATSFYSGDVAYKGAVQITSAKNKTETYATDLVWQGYGTLYRTSNVADLFGTPGAFYCGQFYNGIITGFGIGNILNPAKGLENLGVGLYIADREIHRFKTLDLGTQWLTEEDVPADAAGMMLKLLPEMGTAVKGKFAVDGETIYSGGLVQGKPYGLGRVIYKDGFADIGFWKDGERVDPEKLLSSLLPDPSVLQPKVVTEPAREAMQGKAKKDDRRYVEFWSGQTFWWERTKKQVKYYAAFTADNAPAGWGWKVALDKRGEPEGGFFNGSLAQKKTPNNADTLFVQASADWAKAAYWARRGQFGNYRSAMQTGNYYSWNRAEKHAVVLNAQDEAIVGKSSNSQGAEFSRRSAYSDDSRFREAVLATIDADLKKNREE